MKTPIADFVQNYAKSDISRLHMPGHKAVGPLGVEALDITEIDGADVLYDANGIILQSEQNAAALFDAGRTFYATEGSSLCIKAMLAIATAGKGNTVLAARNVHKAFLYGAALLDLAVVWLYPQEEEHRCACRVTPERLRETIRSMKELPSAVYVTSPDYLGNVQDVPALAAVCRDYHVPLLVDNAHGAYLKFLAQSQHPIDLGAAMCCDSAHKTLPVLTGGAYLHISPSAPASFAADAERFLALFASTSPSYLVLQSLDLCNRYLCDGYRDRLAQTVCKVDRLKRILREHGYSLCGEEPLKLTVMCSPHGEELAKTLRRHHVEPEFCDRDAVVLMFTPETDQQAYDRIEAAFLSIPCPPSTEVHRFPQLCPPTVLGLREAIFAGQKTVPPEEALGCICAAPVVSCPPAVPIVMSGERITEAVITRLRYYGYREISVVAKEPSAMGDTGRASSAKNFENSY